MKAYLLCVTYWASILHFTLKHSIFLYRFYKSSNNFQVGLSKSPNLNFILEWSLDLNTFLLRKSKIKYPLNLKNLNTWTWLVPNNFLWFVIIKIKSESVPLGHNLSLFEITNHYKLLNPNINDNNNEELEKFPLKLCLSIKFNHSWLNDIAITMQVICV